MGEAEELHAAVSGPGAATLVALPATSGCSFASKQTKVTTCIR